jgi:hypothetical protein
VCQTNLDELDTPYIGFLDTNLLNPGIRNLHTTPFLTGKATTAQCVDSRDDNLRPEILTRGCVLARTLESQPWSHDESWNIYAPDNLEQPLRAYDKANAGSHLC